jgi:hypothetical protein
MPQFGCHSLSYLTLLHFLHLSFYKRPFSYYCFVMTSLYSAVPLTYFCGHQLNINKIISSYLICKTGWKITLSLAKENLRIPAFIQVEISSDLGLLLVFSLLFSYCILV